MISDSQCAYTETRTYAKGYQLTDFSTSEAGDVTIITHGSYTYDTNNNLLTTKMLDATRNGTQLAYRGEWTFTYDRKNRLITHTNTNAGNVRGNIWYDGQGRVWQRWNYNTSTTEWAGTLTRFVYDGSQLVQEHTVGAFLNGSWVYTYSDINRDYLHQPAGLRQREGSASAHTDYYIQPNQGVLEFKAERDAVGDSLSRTERTSSLDQLATSTFENISHLATSGSFIESYGGGTSVPTAGFDGLMQRGGRHYLAGLERFLGRRGNNPYQGNFVGPSIGGAGIAKSPSSDSTTMQDIPGHDWGDPLYPVIGRAGDIGPGTDVDDDCWCGSNPNGESRDCCCMLFRKCDYGSSERPGEIPCAIREDDGTCYYFTGRFCGIYETGANLDFVCYIYPVCTACECCEDDDYIEEIRNTHFDNPSDWEFVRCVAADTCYFQKHYGFDWAEEELVQTWANPETLGRSKFECWGADSHFSERPWWEIFGRNDDAATGYRIQDCDNIVVTGPDGWSAYGENVGVPGSVVLRHVLMWCNCSGISSGFGGWG